MQRVAILGNAGGGKSTLARRLHGQLGLPMFGVDEIQWRPGWTAAPEDEVRRQLMAIQASDRWVIEGIGPWDVVEDRVARADTVVLVDLPVWMHHWLAAARMVAAADGSGPSERMPGCDELAVRREMFELIDRFDRDLTPRLRDLVTRVEHAHVHHVTHLDELDLVNPG